MKLSVKIILLSCVIAASIASHAFSQENAPVIQLNHKGHLYDGWKGSSCWGDLCRDTAFPAPKNTISVTGGDKVDFKVHGYDQPAKMNVTVFKPDQTVFKGITLNRGEQSITIDWPAGTYIVGVGGEWPAGDVFYAFKLVVR